MPIYRNEIEDVLAAFEGNMLRGYIPCKLSNGGTANYFGGSNPERYIPMGASGVTIACGLDLGQQSASGLKRMVLPAELVAIFRPYLGKQGAEAVEALHAAPFSISAEQCAVVNACVHADYIERAASLFDRNSRTKSFADLPWQAQAVIVSLFYQLGGPQPSANHPGYPILYSCLCDGDWQAAARELKTGFRRYVQRRAAEAELLEEI